MMQLKNNIIPGHHHGGTGLAHLFDYVDVDPGLLRAVESYQADFHDKIGQRFQFSDQKSQPYYHTHENAGINYFKPAQPDDAKDDERDDGNRMEELSESIDLALELKYLEEQIKTSPEPIQAGSESVHSVDSFFADLSAELSEDVPAAPYAAAPEPQLGETDSGPTDRDFYQYYAYMLVDQISDFEASQPDDPEYCLKKTFDKRTGQIRNRTTWTDEQIGILRAYIYHLQANKLRTHFGPLIHIVKKSKADMKKKYVQIYMTTFTPEERSAVVEMAREMMVRDCYVDFQAIGERLGKTSQNCIYQYCAETDRMWTGEMDGQLTAYVRKSVTKPPFWSILAYHLGLYEMACIRRYYTLGLDRDSEWDDQEIESLVKFWDNRPSNKRASIAEALDLLPRHKICEIRAKLEQMGKKVSRVKWE